MGSQSINMADNTLKVTFLGTGTSTGVPVIACNCQVCRSKDPRDRRFRTSALISSANTTFAIDCGPDFRIQMLRNNIEDIDAILFTHSHRDHVAGLDDIRAFNYVLNKTIEVYGKQEVLDAIRTEFPYIFAKGRYFGAPQLNLNIITEEVFRIGDLSIIPINIFHGEDGIFGYRIQDFTYITDASHITPGEMKKIQGSRVIVLNALRNSRHISHFSLPESIAVLNELHPEKAYLTHISHFLGLHEEVEKKLPSFISLAYDGLKIEV
jgi:phosphoribosyl 1,2-cyclic phosphate phosphodiesterase